MKNKIKFKPSFLSIKSIPTLFWSSPKTLTIKPPLISLIFLVLGLIIFGIGEALLIAAGVGVSPWTVLAQGISQLLGWSVGFSTFIISVSAIICWIPLRQTPGIGTVLNAIIIALVLEYLLPYIPTFESMAFRIIQATFGVIVTGFGGGLYLIANLGPGPRDGLMTGLQKLTNYPISRVRSLIEISVIILGWLLGGIVGIGTLLFAFGIGPAVAASLFGLKLFFEEKTSSQKE